MVGPNALQNSIHISKLSLQIVCKGVSDCPYLNGWAGLYQFKYIGDEAEKYTGGLSHPSRESSKCDKEAVNNGLYAGKSRRAKVNRVTWFSTKIRDHVSRHGRDGRHKAHNTIEVKSYQTHR